MGQESTLTVRCYTEATGLIAPRWATAKAICIATHFGTSPSLAEQNHRELPSIPIIIKANISHTRHTRAVMELIKHRPNLQLRNDAHVYLPTRKRRPACNGPSLASYRRRVRDQSQEGDYIN